MSPLAAWAATLYMLVALLVALRSTAPWAEAVVKPGAGSLPDFATDPPFKAFDEPASRALSSALLGATETRTPCAMVKVGPGFPDVRGNLCDAADASRIRDIIAGVAPSLDTARLALWKVDLDEDARPELLVTYSLTAHEPGIEAPYLAVWLVRPGDLGYEPLYAGTYLAGQIHAVTRFGPPPKSKVVFVRSRSCAGCRPSVHLHAISFGEGDVPVGLFQFTYAEDHAAWTSAIEYERPRRDTSVDATIDTRVPRREHPATPHLIQLFRLDAGKAEWWLFRCAGLRCDYERHADRLPGQHLRAWHRAEKL